MTFLLPFSSEISEKGQTDIDPFHKIQERNKDFHWVDTELYHMSRRKEILKKYPEITKLYGTDIRTFPLVLAISLAQLLLAVLVKNLSIWGFIFVGYVIGGTLTHWLQTASHELSHDLCFKKRWANKMLAIFANFPTGIPSAISFQRYHAEHHCYHGVDQLDPDIPTMSEAQFFRTPVFKVVWVFLLPFFYALRPVFRRPKRPGFWEFLNIVTVAIFDFFFAYFFGLNALLFLVFSCLIGMGLHPVAGNLIAEHYEFVNDLETYSYYGPLNLLNFNVGYHNEHHDFPRIPWTKLPEVTKKANEFYKDLPCYSSYLKVFYYYIFSPEMGPFARIKRNVNVIKKQKKDK